MEEGGMEDGGMEDGEKEDGGKEIENEPLMQWDLEREKTNN